MAEDLSLNLQSNDLVAEYLFDNSLQPFKDTSGNSHHGEAEAEGFVVQHAGVHPPGIAGGSAEFQSGAILVDSLKQFDFGSQFTVCFWYMRTGGDGNYQGLVGNGWYTRGSL